ncbi:MAG: sugar ABC transporter permease [Chloroflexota bacterium]
MDVPSTHETIELPAHTTDSQISRRRTIGAHLSAYGFVAPAGILVILFFSIPMVLVIAMSMTNLATDNFTTNISEWEYVGFDQYRILANDPFASRVFFNTIFYVLFTLAFFNVGLALVVSLLTAHIPRRAGFAFRALWMLPRITTAAIYILMWERIIADVPFGVLNQFGTALNMAPVNFKLDHPWVFVILINGFIGVSFGMIIFTSAIEAIPDDIMNASLVDGSTVMQRIRYIILPILRWPLLFVVTYQTLSLLTSFEQILLFTDGGPNNRTEVWALAAYHRALSNYFGNTQWGYGAAFSVVLVVVGVILAVIYMRVFRFDELVSEPRIEVL